MKLGPAEKRKGAKEKGKENRKLVEKITLYFEMTNNLPSEALQTVYIITTSELQ